MEEYQFETTLVEVQKDESGSGREATRGLEVEMDQEHMSQGSNYKREMAFQRRGEPGQDQQNLKTVLTSEMDSA